MNGGNDMKTTNELQSRINEFPSNYKKLAEQLLSDIQNNALSSNQIEGRIKQEIREIVLEEMNNETN